MRTHDAKVPDHCEDGGYMPPATWSLRWLGLWGLALALAALPWSATAQNSIHGVRVLAESAGELTLEVDYTYSGDHGPTVFINALARAGDSAPKTGYRAGVAQPGRHATSVVLVAPADDDWYTTSEVLVQMYVGTSGPLASNRYSYAKTWSRPTASMPPALHLVGVPIMRVASEAGATDPVQRRFAVDGTVEIVYRDGSLKRLYQGGFTLVTPDGQARPYSYSTLQAPTPPLAPPDDEHARWVDFESARLLSVIRDLVGQNQATVSHYLAKEPADASPYARISMRREAIERMVRP